MNLGPQFTDQVHEDAEEYPDTEYATSDIFGASLGRPAQQPDWIHETRTWGARTPETVNLGGVRPSQPGVIAGGLSHYLNNDSDNNDTYEREALGYGGAGWGAEQRAAAYDDPADEVLNRYPNIIRQGGESFVHHGHHRVAAALLSGEQEVKARVVDLDKHPQDSRKARGRSR